MNSKFCMLKVVFFSCLLLFQPFFSDLVYSQDSQSAQNQVKKIAVETIPKAPGQFSVPDIVKISDTILKIGDITINRKDHFVSIKGKINMSDGPVEYLACNPKGKLHESVLILFAEPYHIQVALLLLGLIPGDRPIEFQGAPELPCGDPVKILVSWVKNNKTVEFSPEHLVFNVENKQVMDKADWVFSGSKILDKQYMAQVEGSIAAIYHDPFAIIDHRNITGADDMLFHANKEILPSVGTSVIFKIFVETDQKIIQRVSCKKVNQ